MKITLAPNFAASIWLAIDPKLSLPSPVSQSYLRASSERRIIAVPNGLTTYRCRRYRRNLGAFD